MAPRSARSYLAPLLCIRELRVFSIPRYSWHPLILLIEMVTAFCVCADSVTELFSRCGEVVMVRITQAGSHDKSTVLQTRTAVTSSAQVHTHRV